MQFKIISQRNFRFLTQKPSNLCKNIMDSIQMIGNSTPAPFKFKPGQALLLKNFQDSGVIENAPLLYIDDDAEILIVIKFIIYTESHTEIGFDPLEVSYVSNMGYMMLKKIFIDNHTQEATVDCVYMEEYVPDSIEIESAMKVDLLVIE